MASTLESLLEQGYQARREHRLADAKRAYQQAVERCRQSDNPPSLAIALKGLGQIERDLHEIEVSLQHYQESADLYRTLDNPLALAHTVRHVGDILRGSNQLAAAKSCYEEALAIYRSHPETNTLDLANTLRGFALLQSLLRQKEEAIALWQEAGHLYNQVWQEPGSPYKESDLAPGISESQRQIALLTAS